MCFRSESLVSIIRDRNRGGWEVGGKRVLAHILFKHTEEETLDGQWLATSGTASRVTPWNNRENMSNPKLKVIPWKTFFDELWRWRRRRERRTTPMNHKKRCTICLSHFHAIKWKNFSIQWSSNLSPGWVRVRRIRDTFQIITIERPETRPLESLSHSQVVQQPHLSSIPPSNSNQLTTWCPSNVIN